MWLRSYGRIYGPISGDRRCPYRPGQEMPLSPSHRIRAANSAGNLSFFRYVRVYSGGGVGGSRVEIATPGGDCEFRVREFKCNIGT